MADLTCQICFHHCRLAEGKTGFCRARRNEKGKNVCANYGRLTSMAMDPIEKKPLKRFYPGSWILSVGSYGCSFACPFCQNYSISMENENSAQWTYVSPEELARLARSRRDNLGLAFTYNEPMISWEYIVDCARLIRPDQKVVLVTNGCAEMTVLNQLLPVTDAMNIDYKGPDAFYEELHGSGPAVRACIEACIPRTHVEVTTLIVPGKNDDPVWIEETARWLASLDRETAWHLSRYFPRYHYALPATDPEVIRELGRIARKYLPHVFLGNMPGGDA